MNNGDVYLVKPDNNILNGNERPAIIVDNGIQFLTTQNKNGLKSVIVDSKKLYVIPKIYKITDVMFIKPMGKGLYEEI
jgi:hypothetical protein